MTTPRTIRAEPILDLAALLNGWHLVHVGISLAGDLAVLCSKQPPTIRLGYVVEDEPGGQSKQIPDRFRIFAPMKHGTRVVELAGKDRAWHRVQQLGRDTWVLVYNFPNSAVGNIGIVSSSGHLIGSFGAGFALDDVQTTPDGRIWAFYELEGVESGPEEGRTFAQHGAICFSPTGNQLFRYHDLERSFPARQSWWDVMPRVYWGHGNNVAGDSTTWISTCDGLVKLEDYCIKATWPEDWRARSSGIPCTQAFAIDGTRPLLADKEPHTNGMRCVYRLLDLYSLQHERIDFTSAAGEVIDFIYATGRGPYLYLIREHDIHRIDLRII